MIKHQSKMLVEHHSTYLDVEYSKRAAFTKSFINFMFSGMTHCVPVNSFVLSHKGRVILDNYKSD